MTLVDTLYPWIAAVPGGVPVIGINGPQGAGKTTLVNALVARAASEGKRWFALSIDDVYRTHADLAPAPRGPPGTHDVALGAQVLDALRAPAGAVAVPAYDKAAFAGKGDRRPVKDWPAVELPLDRILFEGWMLGFPSVAPGDGLDAYRPWNERLAALVQLRVADPETIVRWRIEAEVRMRAAGRGGMTDAEVETYIRSFLPYYAVYPAALAADPPTPRHRVVWVGPDRAPVGRV